MSENDFSTPKSARLPLEFYIRTDVLQIARELLGKVLVTEFDGQRTSGRITETEAYRAPDDRACHAFGNRRTARTEIMFQEGGRAYIYLCYGIHHLFNVVTGPENSAHAVLIRAIEPLDGYETMLTRRGKPLVTSQKLQVTSYKSKVTSYKSKVTSYKSKVTSHKSQVNGQQSTVNPQKSTVNSQRSTVHLTTGPGALSQALGLTTLFTGQSLLAPDAPVWIEDSYDKILKDEIAAGPRIGVDYSGECAAWPWRFWLKNSPFVKKGAMMKE